MASSSKWKTGLLKTGLPLEYVTARSLSERGHSIFGEYPYTRPDESGKPIEFFVDIRTYKSLSFGGHLIVLSMLVECKYRQPGTTWVFAPLPADTYPIGLVQSTEDISPIRLNDKALWDFEKQTGYCVSGVELTSDGSGNTSGTKHGIFQLKYAMLHLIANSMGHNYEECVYDGNHIDISCPIIVTTADLRLIKPGLSLEDFRQANELSEVTDAKDALILNERPGPQLQTFAVGIGNQFTGSHPSLFERLKALDRVLVGPEWEKRYAPDLDTIRRVFEHSVERVLVINYESLDLVLDKLDAAIGEVLTTVKSYGSLVTSSGVVSLTDLEGSVVAADL